jgi:Domain of unknown function (DUF4377)
MDRRVGWALVWSACGTEREVVVDHYLQPCQGMAPQTCTRVAVDGEPFRLQYDGIDGFDFRWGVVSTLRVSERPRRHPPADGSSLQWRAREVTDEVEVDPGETFVFDVGDLAATYIDYGALELAGRAFQCGDEVDCGALAADPGLAHGLTFAYADPIDDPLWLVAAE